MWHVYNQCRSVNNRFYIAIKDSINNDNDRRPLVKNEK